jgi:hypothetical protein
MMVIGVCPCVHTPIAVITKILKIVEEFQMSDILSVTQTVGTAYTEQCPHCCLESDFTLDDLKLKNGYRFNCSHCNESLSPCSICIGTSTACGDCIGNLTISIKEAIEYPFSYGENAED